MKPHYYIGLDLGLAQDYTALVVLERPVSGGGCYHLRYLQRFQLGTSSTVIVPTVRQPGRDIGPQWPHTTLVVGTPASEALSWAVSGERC